MLQFSVKCSLPWASSGIAFTPASTCDTLSLILEAHWLANPCIPASLSTVVHVHNRVFIHMKMSGPSIKLFIVFKLTASLLPQTVSHYKLAAVRFQFMLISYVVHSLLY